MKRIKHVFAFAAIITFVFSGCAKQPAQEIDAAKAAIQAVEDAQGALYAPDELKALRDEFQVAMDEINTQSKKFFKKFGGSKEKLTKIVSDAEAVSAIIPARIEESKAAAEVAMNEAKMAWDEAKALLEKAPRGKGTQADIAAYRADLAGLEEAAKEAMASFEGGDFPAAKDKADAIKEKATSISNEIKAAIEKVRR